MHFSEQYDIQFLILEVPGPLFEIGQDANEQLVLVKFLKCNEPKHSHEEVQQFSQ